MHEVYEDSIDRENVQKLQQLMLNFPFILELKQTFSFNDFTELLSATQYQKTIRREPISLMTGFIYFFLEKGAIYRRQITGKTEQFIRGKQKSWISTTSKGLNHLNESKESPRFHIQQFDSYEPPQNLSKYMQDFYYPSHHKHSTVLYINLALLKPHIYDRIRQQCHQKIRLISRAEQMHQVERSAIVDRLHKFRYLQLHFGQILYSRAIRSDLIFILKAGLVEILAGKKRSGFVVNPISLIAFQKAEDEWARCTSEKVQCFSIHSEEFACYFPSMAQVAAFNDPKLKTFEGITASYLNSVQGDQNDPCSSPAANISQSQKDQSGFKGNISKRRYHHKSMQNLKDYDRKKGRMLALRQHFPNYYNEIFEQFSEQKAKKVKFIEEHHKDLNLYKIKILQRKAPAMEQLKNKLKKIRIEKISASKERLRRKVYIQTFQGSGVTVIEQQL